MANIRVRSGVRCVTYQVQVRLAGHPQVTKTFSTRSDAEAWARDLEVKLSKGELADSEAERRNLVDACEQYLRTHPEIGRDHARVVKWWRDTYGGRKLARVSTPWLTEIRDELAAGSYQVGPPDRRRTKRRKPGTVNRTMTYLRTVLSYCVQIGWMSRSPTVAKLTEGKRMRFLSDDELKALTKALEKCSEPVMLPFVERYATCIVALHRQAASRVNC